MVFMVLNTMSQQKLITESLPTLLKASAPDNLDEPRRFKLADGLRDASKGDSSALGDMPIVGEAVAERVLVGECG